MPLVLSSEAVVICEFFPLPYILDGHEHDLLDPFDFDDLRHAVWVTRMIEESCDISFLRRIDYPTLVDLSIAQAELKITLRIGRCAVGYNATPRVPRKDM